MKKLITLAAAALLIAGSAFALDFEIGGRFFMGTNLGNSEITDLASGDASAKNKLKDINLDSNLDYGFGVYSNFALFGGLGVQGELNLTKGSASIGGLASGAKADDYSVWTLDAPIMLWANFDLWRFTIGAGAGVNFSFDLQSGSFKDLYGQVSSNAKDNMFRTGFACGTDAKFYFTEHLGLVASGRFIMDFSKKEVPVKVEGIEAGASYPTISFDRRSLYGGLGLEWKFF